MVKLGIATGSRGPNGESTGHRNLPVSDQQHLYSYPLVRSEDNFHQSSHQIYLDPSTSSHLQLRLDNQNEVASPLLTEPRISPIRSRNESIPLTSAHSPLASGSSSVGTPSRSHVSGWPRTSGRDSGESVIRSQKRSYRETEDHLEVYAKEVKRCPVCRSAIYTGVIHHCPISAQHGANLYARAGPAERSHEKAIAADHQSSSHISSLNAESFHHRVTSPEGGLNFCSRNAESLHNRVTSAEAGLNFSNRNAESLHNRVTSPEGGLNFSNRNAESLHSKVTSPGVGLNFSNRNAESLHYRETSPEGGLNFSNRNAESLHHRVTSPEGSLNFSNRNAENLHHRVTSPEGGLNFSNRISGLRVPLPSSNPHSISPGTSSHSLPIPPEDLTPITSTPIVKDISSRCVERLDPPRSPISINQASTSRHLSSSSEVANQNSPSWSGGGNYNHQYAADGIDSWETPTSLISRLTAGLTSRTGQNDDKNERNCPSPSMSESSSTSMTSSHFSHLDTVQPCDPFNMAHQELMEEFDKLSPPVLNHQRHNAKSDARERASEQPYQKRGRRYTSSESASSDVHAGDSRFYGSQDYDTEDNSSSGYLDENGRLPDLDTLLKSIRITELSSYSPDKASIGKFLEAHEIGHINHLIKSVSDAMLTISLPETLYKSKGFTPLDYMDIHLNCVIRHFFFVFKNEDFLNLIMEDQIALLDGCTLRAIQCTSLYLFNKDAGCWHIPGATNKANHPVIHISDLKQVFPHAFVARTYELHTIAAKLGFDWPMGVIASCILMYTPINKVIQEMEKVDLLRDKYINLLLKYISWKHGSFNASLLFPEVLKLLDALLLHVDDFASITLKLNDDEVVAVEERLATITLSQMSPFGSKSSKFKEKITSWSTLDSVRLGDIQNRLCAAMRISMTESVQSANAVYSKSGISLYDPVASQCQSIPQLMPPTDKDYSNDESLEHNAYLNPKTLHQNRDMKNISALAQKDLMVLRKFLEEVTNREGTLVVQNIREKMDSSQIKKIINKLCS